MNIAYLVVFLPLIGSLFGGLFSMQKPNRLPQVITTLLMFGSMISSYFLFKKVIFDKESFNLLIFNFFDLHDLVSNFTIRVDSLSVIMMILVTTVSFCVHLYSMSYMSDDTNINRFFAYLSMFTFCMLILISSDDFLQLFFGWEGVGLSSYLLISFWYKKNSASSAAMKAFVVNRIGDFGLILAIAFCYFIFHSINFTEISKIFDQYTSKSIQIFGIDFHSMTLIAILLFIGAMGKSAQFGLHVWLPDAMEGPTPVSALIHAATMVTAGIFLVARCYYFFDASIIAQSLILIISSITMIFAASVAIFQNDIKKTIAYSTCSQLGYMFVGCAVGRYDAGMFHLVTHGFFKALLFLSAGSIIHATHEQNMNCMPSRLWKSMPFTFILMLIGTFAIVGIPPFAGFYSKDAIIEALFVSNNHLSFVNKFAYISAMITVFFTAFYSWKLIFKIFFSKNSENNQNNHTHESDSIITLPMFILSIFALSSGFILMKYLGILDESSIFWNKIIEIKSHSDHHPSFFIEILPLIISFCGFGLSYFIFMINTNKNEKDSKIYQFSPAIYSAFENKLYIDEIYQKIFVRPLFFISQCVNFFDQRVLDRFGVNGLRNLCYSASSYLRNKYHHGILYKYNFWQFFVLTILVMYFVLLIINGGGK
jgi:NADH-quinone oxidoreductase subunit L